MRDIDHLITQIDEEIGDAMGYAENAVLKKDCDRSLADAYYSLSNQELNHASTLRDQVIRIVRAYEGDDSDCVNHIWDWAHKRAMEREMGVRAVLASYK